MKILPGQDVVEPPVYLDSYCFVEFENAIDARLNAEPKAQITEGIIALIRPGPVPPARAGGQAEQQVEEVLPVDPSLQAEQIGNQPVVAGAVVRTHRFACGPEGESLQSESSTSVGT